MFYDINSSAMMMMMIRVSRVSMDLDCYSSSPFIVSSYFPHSAWLNRSARQHADCACGVSASCNMRREAKLVCGLFLGAISSTVSGKDGENDPETGCVLCSSTSELFLLNAHTGVPSAVNVFMKLLTTVFVFALVA